MVSRSLFTCSFFLGLACVSSTNLRFVTKSKTKYLIFVCFEEDHSLLAYQDNSLFHCWRPCFPVIWPHSASSHVTHFCPHLFRFELYPSYRIGPYWLLISLGPDYCCLYPHSSNPLPSEFFASANCPRHSSPHSFSLSYSTHSSAYESHSSRHRGAQGPRRFSSSPPCILLFLSFDSF